jgi:hypothetical protein
MLAGTRKTTGPPPGTRWVLVEPDIDYFQDMTAHFLLEVIPGFFGLTDPRTVYVLRWIAGTRQTCPSSIRRTRFVQ